MLYFSNNIFHLGRPLQRFLSFGATSPKMFVFWGDFSEGEFSMGRLLQTPTVYRINHYHIRTLIIIITIQKCLSHSTIYELYLLFNKIKVVLTSVGLGSFDKLVSSYFSENTSKLSGIQSN